MSQFIDLTLEELNKTLGNRSFYTLRNLVTAGFFGSIQSARGAVKKGQISAIQVSQRRLVVPRQALVDYLNKNLLISPK